MASDDLLQQIARESEELSNVPKLPLSQFLTLTARRCHICGRVVQQSDLAPFETQSTAHGPITRLACPWCHPQRSTV